MKGEQRSVRKAKGEVAWLRWFTQLSWLEVLCIAVVGAGVVLRFVYLARPMRFTFDEHHFVENARNYLAGKADWNDHPPLGKLFEAVSIRTLGDTSLAWRLPSAIFGLGSIVCAAGIAASSFASRRAALLAAAFFAADGFFFAYSRTALIDGHLVFFSLAATWAALAIRGFWGTVSAGLLVGLALGTKFTGICALVPVTVALATQRPPLGESRLLARASCLFVLALGVYLVQWRVGLALSHSELGWFGGFSETERLLEGHERATAATHPLTSSWPTWLTPRRPITLYYREGKRGLVALTMLGNPLIWWMTSATCLASLAQIVWFGARSPIRNEGAAVGLWEERGRALLVLLSGWAAFLAPWILTRRDPYLYHYLPAYAFGVIGLVGYVDHSFKRHPRLGALLVVLVVAAAAVYVPLWAGLLTTPEYFRFVLPFPSWR
ncbi:MAG TPA: glycosyltransferase family 39 protein [Polyangiaceae bacterium]|nr:glycosyltransferase family 39 protein [Polyangiaceae bacterium]